MSAAREVSEGELLRHPTYIRLVHWLIAVFFILALLSGFAVYSPWLFGMLTPLFGGGPATRLLHPWFSLAFVILFGLQMLNWAQLMTWGADDRRWLGHFKAYVTNTAALEPEYVGFFNAGQKIYFWTIAASALLFLVSGIVLWFPRTLGRPLEATAYVVHDIAALVMLVGFVVHIYEGTAAQPGTLRSMLRGTVERRWAWTHHPAWYRQVTGRDPRADYEHARQHWSRPPTISADRAENAE